MAGPITHIAVALMARDRLRTIRDFLVAKERSRGTVHDIERHVRYLAEKAYEIMTQSTPGTAPPVTLYAREAGEVLGDRVGTFLLMGAVGPDITYHAASHAPGQRWLYDTLHKGTPDEHREHVLTGSCNLPLTFWKKVNPKITGDDVPRMQAYVLGHVCHVATDVVAVPFIDELQWQLGTIGPPRREALTKEEVSAAIDAEVGSKFFHRDSHRGSEWLEWWPRPRQVPGELFEAMTEALEETYGTGAVRPGLAAFNEQRTKDDAPPLSKALLRDGYESFLHSAEQRRVWDFWDWVSATWFMFLPSFLAYPLYMALPNGRDHFRAVKPADYNEAKGQFEWVALPLVVNGLAPLYYSIIATTSYLGTESSVIAGWVSTGYQILTFILFFSTLGAPADTVGVRWAFFFALPLVLYVIHVIVTAVKGLTNLRRVQLFLGSIVPPLMGLLMLVFYFAFLHTGIEKILDPNSEPGEFVWRLFVWSLILFASWFIFAGILRWTVMTAVSTEQANELVSKRSHHLRLFDDTTLAMVPRDSSPTLADLFYPAGRRPLLKLWWDGDEEAKVVAHRDKLEFHFGATVRTMPLPPGPTKVSELADYLQRNVKNAANAVGLKAELAFPEAEDFELPPGFALSDEGDGERIAEDRTGRLGALQTLHASSEAPYIVYHALKASLSVRFDQKGPALSTDGTTPAATGAGTVNQAVGSRRITIVPGPNVTRFTQFFRPGDLIEAPQGSSAVRVVVSVESDEEITVSLPFSGGLANTTFARLALDRRQPLVPPAVPVSWTVQSVRNRQLRLQGAGSGIDFGTMFRPGDTIVVKQPAAPDQHRIVTEVISETELMIAQPLTPPLNWPEPATPGGPAPPAPPTAPFERKGEEPESLTTFLGGVEDTLESGGSVMNHAADLAVLLCLGATSHLLTDDQRRHGAVRATTDLNRVYQVFRNWNLDRRRENEWKMIVLGGAVSEKRGDAGATDPAVPTVHDGWSMQAAAGEKTANEMGWLNVLRSWVEMAASPSTDSFATTSFRPGNPTNKDLSRAMAYLLDMPGPA